MNPNGILHHCESYKESNIFYHIILEYLGYLQNNLYTKISCYVTKTCTCVLFDGKILEMRHPARNVDKVCLNLVVGNKGQHNLVAKGPTSQTKTTSKPNKVQNNNGNILRKKVLCLLKLQRQALIII